MFKIVTKTETTWAVIAEWFGAERTVFEGDLFACIAFERANS